MYRRGRETGRGSVSKVQRERSSPRSTRERESENVQVQDIKRAPVSIKGREKGRGSKVQGTEVEGFQVQGSKEGGR
jgi:hypothetical protein